MNYMCVLPGVQQDKKNNYNVCYDYLRMASGRCCHNLRSIIGLNPGLIKEQKEQKRSKRLLEATKYARLQQVSGSVCGNDFMRMQKSRT